MSILQKSHYKQLVILFISLCFLLNTAFASDIEKTKYALLIKQNLEEYLFSKYSDFKITEIFSRKNNSNTFVEKRLGHEFSQGLLKPTLKNYYFSEVNNTGGLGVHLGVLIVNYVDHGLAEKAFQSIKEEGFLSGTKILTKYRAINQGTINIVLFTESAADPLVSEFIENIILKSD